MSTTLKRRRDEEVSVRDFSPKGFEEGEFKDCHLTHDRAQSDSIELWLFKLPPELTADDISASGVTIPSVSAIKGQLDAFTALRNGDENALELYRNLPKGLHFIASFKHNDVSYTLNETLASEAESMVNLWTNESLQKSGEVICGKPFERYFVVLRNVLASNAQYATGPIPFMPMGFNAPFTPKDISLPIGWTNPYVAGKTENILEMHKNDQFEFTSGNMAETAAANARYLKYGNARKIQNTNGKKKSKASKDAEPVTATPAKKQEVKKQEPVSSTKPVEKEKEKKDKKDKKESKNKK